LGGGVDSKMLCCFEKKFFVGKFRFDTLISTQTTMVKVFIIFRLYHFGGTGEHMIIIWRKVVPLNVSLFV
jgi:hypothetical protein